jgi:coproporphyrinogen III oxidase-like Fe-S oxidoreductase
LMSDDVNATRGLHLAYFGRGMPLLAPPPTISAILDAIQELFVLPDGVEVTMEMDPVMFEEDYLGAVRNVGADYVSLGVQSSSQTT